MVRRILVVEDNRDIAGLLRQHLKDIDCDVEVCSDGNTALQRAMSEKFDLVILDLILPYVDGLEICRRLRAQPDYVPIMMLTAKSAEIDRVLGLEVGADDYLSKPFSIRELLARVKALFRRIDAMTHADICGGGILHCNDLRIDAGKRTVHLQEREIELTGKEFDLLWQFASHPGRVYSRTQLLDLVWGYGHEGSEHTVNSHINRLRAKIERIPAQPVYILTVWGIGYKFTDQPAMRGENV
jgi:DNA-binding response OmpR family regulator